MSRSIRYSIRLTQAFFSKFKGLILLGFLLGVVFFLVFRFIFPLFLAGKSEIIGVVGKYKVETLPTKILSQIGNGLTKVDATGAVEPDLAISWDTSDKGKTWTFKLDTSRKWQDGTAVESEDIVYNFSDADVERPDKETISFKLKSDYAPFPAVVSQPVFKQGLLGTGEWKVDKLSVSGNYVQTLTLVDGGKNKRTYKFYPTEDRAKLALKLGQVHVLEGIYSSTPFDKWKTLNVIGTTASDKVVTLFFNTKDNVLSDKTIRQALSYAINKDSLSSNRAVSPISQNSWAFNPQVKPYSYDKERAKTLISDLPSEVKQNLKVDIVTTYILLPVAEQIAKDWNEIGVKSQVLVSSAIPAEYQSFLAIFEIPNDPDQYAVWHSTQSVSNFSKYQNARIDKLLEDGRSQLDMDERRKIYLDFQRFLMEDAPAAFLYYPTLYAVERK